jgi:archaetidylinositol phosphate synthase
MMQATRRVEQSGPGDKEQPVMKPVERIQQNVLAALERRLLNWLCARLPHWVHPDMLTATGFAGAVIVATGYACSSFHTGWLWLAISGYFVNWFGDSLDGSLARFRSIERPKFGYLIDHSTDSLGNMILAVGIGLSPFVRLDIALFGLAGYLLLSIHTFLAARVADEFRLSYVAAGPTELRLALIAMALGMLAHGPGNLAGHNFSIFDVLVLAIALLLMLLFVWQTLRTASKLAARKE